MTNIEMKMYLTEKKIIGPSGKGNFKSFERLYSDEEVLKEWQAFSKNYRSEKEAWCCALKELTPPNCPICGELCKFNGSKKLNFYNTTCGICSANAVPEKLFKFKSTVEKRTPEERHAIKEKQKATNLERYGDSNYGLFGSESFKKNLKEKYGDEHFNNHEKAKETCLERYGVSSNLALTPPHAPDYEKVKKTNLERYGVEHIGQSKDAQKKSLASKRLNQERICEEKDLVKISDLQEKFGMGWYTAKIVPIQKVGIYSFVKKEDVSKIEAYFEEGKCHTNGYVSKKEKDLLSYIKSIYHGKIVENDTSTVPNNNHRYFELDIFLPDEKIAFDFDGNYFHSTKFKDIKYHQRKTLCSYKVGVKLAHILEEDWDKNQESVKNKIKELIFNHRDFNDGFFPSFRENVSLSEPRRHIVGDFEYYDTGIIC